MAKLADSAPSASFALPSSTSARPSTPDVLLAWCRSLAGRQPLGLGEDVGRVAGSVARVQQLGELHGHDGNYGGSAMASEENSCHRPEKPLHRCQLVQYLSVLASTALGGSLASFGPRQPVLIGGQVSRRELSRLTRVGVLESRTRLCGCLSLQGMLPWCNTAIPSTRGRLCWVCRPLAGPREGEVTKPRTAD